MQATSRLKGLDVNQPDLHAFVSFFCFLFLFFCLGNISSTAQAHGGAGCRGGRTLTWMNHNVFLALLEEKANSNVYFNPR